MTFLEVLALVAEVQIDEKAAELQLKSAAPGEEVQVQLPAAGQLEWSSGGHHYKIPYIPVIKVK